MTIHRRPECFEDCVLPVSHGGHVTYNDPRLIQTLGDESLIGVDNLPDEQFIANGNNLGGHHVGRSPRK